MPRGLKMLTELRISFLSLKRKCLQKKSLKSMIKPELIFWRGLKTLAEAIKSSQPSSQTPIRRMNRFQYANAVKDLLKLKVEVYPLPERMMRDAVIILNQRLARYPPKSLSAVGRLASLA